MRFGDSAHSRSRRFLIRFSKIFKAEQLLKQILPFPCDSLERPVYLHAYADQFHAGCGHPISRIVTASALAPVPYDAADTEYRFSQSPYQKHTCAAHKGFSIPVAFDPANGIHPVTKVLHNASFAIRFMKNVNRLLQRVNRPLRVVNCIFPAECDDLSADSIYGRAYAFRSHECFPCWGHGCVQLLCTRCVGSQPVNPTLDLLLRHTRFAKIPKRFQQHLPVRLLGLSPAGALLFQTKHFRTGSAFFAVRIVTCGRGGILPRLRQIGQYVPDSLFLRRAAFIQRLKPPFGFHARFYDISQLIRRLQHAPPPPRPADRRPRPPCAPGAPDRPPNCPAPLPRGSWRCTPGSALQATPHPHR